MRRVATIVVQSVEPLKGDRVLVLGEGGERVELDASGCEREFWLAAERGVIFDLMR